MSDPRPLGRADARPHIDSIKASLRVAPRLFRGEIPSKSPNIRRFRNPRPHRQWRGTCVGQALASLAETTIRTPDGFGPDTPPNPAVDISPLYVYHQAREYTARTDPSIYRGDGAIVSHALLALLESGFVGWDAWPCTEANERAYRDGQVPKAAANAKKHMPVGDARRLVDPDQILEYMAAGYSVCPGVPWPRGAMETSADGSFAWTGRSVGGHAFELIDYDKDLDRIWVANSWPGWGDQLGIGHTSLRAMLATLSARNLASGASEAVVISNVDGWGVKPDLRKLIYDAL